MLEGEELGYTMQAYLVGIWHNGFWEMQWMLMMNNPQQTTPALPNVQGFLMPPSLWLFLFFYGIGLCVLIFVMKRVRRYYPVAKGALSIAFVFGALLAFLMGSRQATALFLLLFLALVCCAAGDILLGVANRKEGKVSPRPFLGGTFCFFLAHLFFCVLYFMQSPFRWWDLLLPGALVFCMWLLSRGGAIKLKKMWAIGYSYTFLVGLMATKAIYCAVVAGIWSGFGLFTGAGAVLFLFSDVFLLFLYFGTKQLSWLRSANLTTYYAGIVLLCLSAYWY